ncbi:hypothetical protein TNCV_1014161 [Trichonephila clavipes]|uniref:Uncharacterized protein n=1 Tax=Trichonephila clavipes TaxID=2585209 RepID=A0A8X6VXG3_TRICX|nr:hypothetical protein TNCV_1014161 [Trichonephila clavipes]
MIPAYIKKRCAAFPFETGIHFRRKTDFFPEEDTTMSYSGFEPEPTRLQAEGYLYLLQNRQMNYTVKYLFIYPTPVLDHLTPSLRVPTDDVVSREFIESSVLEQGVAIHSGIFAEWAGLVSSQASGGILPKSHVW